MYTGGIRCGACRGYGEHAANCRFCRVGICDGCARACMLCLKCGERDVSVGASRQRIIRIGHPQNVFS